MGNVNKFEYQYAKLMENVNKHKDDIIEVDDREIILLGLTPINNINLDILSIEWESNEDIITYQGMEANLPNIIVYWNDNVNTIVQTKNKWLNIQNYYKVINEYDIIATIKNHSTDILKVNVIDEHETETIDNNKIITYKATEKLQLINGTSEGINPLSFNSTLISHSFANGMGILTFNDDITNIGNDAFRNCINL